MVTCADYNQFPHFSQRYTPLGAELYLHGLLGDASSQDMGIEFNVKYAGGMKTGSETRGVGEQA